MKKYHIKKDGTPGECKAESPHSCPLGAIYEHFSSQEAAEDYAYQRNKAKYGAIPGVGEDEVFDYYFNKWNGNPPRINVKKKELENLHADIMNALSKLTENYQEINAYRSKANYNRLSENEREAHDKEIKRLYSEINVEVNKAYDSMKLISINYTTQVSQEDFYNELTSHHSGGDEWVLSQAKVYVKDAIANNGVYKFHHNPYG